MVIFGPNFFWSNIFFRILTGFNWSDWIKWFVFFVIASRPHQLLGCHLCLFPKQKCIYQYYDYPLITFTFMNEPEMQCVVVIKGKFFMRWLFWLFISNNNISVKKHRFCCMMHWFRQSLFGWWFFGLYSIILLNYLVTLLLFFSSFSIWESLFPFTDLLSNNKFFIFHSKCDFSFTLTQYCSCYMIIPWIFVTIGTSKGSRLVFAIWIYDWRLNQLKLHNLKLQLQLQLEFYFTLNQNFNSVESILFCCVLFTSVQLNQFIVIVRVTFTFC